MAVVTRRALVGGRPAGLRAASGVVVGLLVWGSLAVLGLTALLTAAPRVYLAVRIVGAGYLLFLGVQALRGGKDHHDPAGTGSAGGRPFVTGSATNMLNPKIAVFYTALLPTLAPASLGAWGLAMLVTVHAAVTLGWLTGYAAVLDVRARCSIDRGYAARSTGARGSCWWLSPCGLPRTTEDVLRCRLSTRS